MDWSSLGSGTGRWELVWSSQCCGSYARGGSRDRESQEGRCEKGIGSLAIKEQIWPGEHTLQLYERHGNCRTCPRYCLKAMGTLKTTCTVLFVEKPLRWRLQCPSSIVWPYNWGRTRYDRATGQTWLPVQRLVVIGYFAFCLCTSVSPLLYREPGFCKFSSPAHDEQL
jgi:hypothetical protein